MNSDKNIKIVKYCVMVGLIWVGLGSIMVVRLMTMILWMLKGLSRQNGYRWTRIIDLVGMYVFISNSLVVDSSVVMTLCLVYSLSHPQPQPHHQM